MNGYELSKRYWDWAFRNPHLRTPSHAALYFWAIEWNNRKDWADIIDFIPQYAMTAIGINSYNTYKKVFADLVGAGFFKVLRPGKNQHTPCLISLSKISDPLDESYGEITPAMSCASSGATSVGMSGASSSGMSKFDRASDTANSSALSRGMSVGMSKFDEAPDIPLDIPRDAITKNNKPKPKTKTKTVEVGDFADAPSLPESDFEIQETEQKKEKPPRSAAPPIEAKEVSVVTLMRRAIEAEVEGYYWTAKDGANAKQLADKIRLAVETKSMQPCSDDEVVSTMLMIIQRSKELREFYHFTDIPNLNSKFNEIITQLKSGGRQQPSGGVRRQDRIPDAQFGNEIDHLIARLYGT